MARKRLRELSDEELDARIRAARAPTLKALHRKTFFLRREWLRRDHPISDYEKARAVGDTIRTIEEGYERQRHHERLARLAERQRAQQQAREQGRRARLGWRDPVPELVREAFGLVLERRRHPGLPTSGEAQPQVMKLLLDRSAFETIKDRLLRRGIVTFSIESSDDDPDTFKCWVGSRRGRGSMVMKPLTLARVTRIVSEELTRRRTNQA